MIGIAPAPLLPGEVEADYVDVASRIVAVAQPRDATEEFLTRVVDGIWEILRLCRLKAGLLRMACSDGVRTVASKLGYKLTSMGTVHDLSVKWMSGDAKTRKEFAEILKKAGLGMEDVRAEALSSKIDTFERIDRMLASSEARRNNALREIDRHRAALGAAMRQALDEVRDADFRDVETGVPRVGAPP